MLRNHSKIFSDWMYKLNASTKEIKQIFSQLPTKYKMLYVGSQKDIYVLNENT